MLEHVVGETVGGGLPPFRAVLALAGPSSAGQEVGPFRTHFYIHGGCSCLQAKATLAGSTFHNKLGPIIIF